VVLQQTAVAALILEEATLAAEISASNLLKFFDYLRVF
jgi:hypothetical protein